MDDHDPIQVNDLIALREAVAEHSLVAGRIGCVRQIFASDEIEVEFVDETRTSARILLKIERVRVLRHEAALDEAAFWHMIEDAKAESKGDGERECQLLVDRLAQMSIADIFAFGDLFHKFYALAYRRDLWGAAYVIGSGCSDGGFEDFRGWLIAQGEQVFYEALRDPETLVDLAGIKIKCDGINLYGDARLWAMNHADWDAYEKKTGEEAPILVGVWTPDELKLTGSDWNEDTVDTLYPKLAAKFWGKRCDEAN